MMHHEYRATVLGEDLYGMGACDSLSLNMTAGELLNQTDDENTIIRHSVNFPPGMYRALQEKAKKQYRSSTPRIWMSGDSPGLLPACAELGWKEKKIYYPCHLRTAFDP